MQAFRRSHSLPLLALLAIIVQLLLPMRHAAAMAHDNGNPLLMAFCGSASPQAMQRLREAAPPDLLAALNLKAAQDKTQSSDDAPCGFCKGLSGLQSAALAYTPIALDLAAPVTAAPLLLSAASPVLRGILPPPARGPPLQS